MADKIKLESTSDSKVMINLTNLNGKVIPVSPKGFCYLTEDELSYLRNVSKIFDRGSLKVVGDVPEGVEIPSVSPNALSDADITAMLKKPQKQIELALADIDNIKVVQRILEFAKNADKAIKVIETIEAKIESLME